MAITVAALAGSVFGQEFDPLGELPEEFQGHISGYGGEYSDSRDAFARAPRCFVHEMSLPGQGVYISGSGVYISGSGVYISGSTRGLVLGDTVTVKFTNPPGTVMVPAVEPGPLVAPQPASGVENYASLFGAQPRAGSTVGILVVDDFAGQDIRQLSNLLDNLSTLIPGDEATLESRFVSGDLSHGLFVLKHLKTLIEATENYRFESLEDEWFQWVHNNEADARLVVVPVDISGRMPGDPIIPINTVAIVKSIHEAIYRYADLLNLVTVSGSLVVNMSWVLLPCATVEDFVRASNQFDSFEQYVMGLEIDQGQETPSHDDLAWRVSLLRWVPDDDPLRSYFNGTHQIGTFEASGVDVALIAAAGNFNMMYQMLPAALPTVLGVGTPLNNQPPPEFSNAGDVGARGAWFHVDHAVSYGGTSYSAPLISLFAAVDYAANKSCMPVGANAQRPGFGIVKPLGGYMGPRTTLDAAAVACFAP